MVEAIQASTLAFTESAARASQKEGDEVNDRIHCVVERSLSWGCCRGMVVLWHGMAWYGMA